MIDDRKARTYVRRDKILRDGAVGALLADAGGRKYLWWLLEISGVGQQPFASNALTTSFNCGQLNVGQQILAHLMEINPAGYVQMMKEQQDEWNARERGDNRNDGSDDGNPTA